MVNRGPVTQESLPLGALLSDSWTGGSQNAHSWGRGCQGLSCTPLSSTPQGLGTPDWALGPDLQWPGDRLGAVAWSPASCLHSLPPPQPASDLALDFPRGTAGGAPSSGLWGAHNRLRPQEWGFFLLSPIVHPPAAQLCGRAGHMPRGAVSRPQAWSPVGRASQAPCQGSRGFRLTA